MVRALLILLLLVLAVPAAAMPNCAGATTARVGHVMPGKHAPDAMPAHACIGCIPPSDWLAPRVAAPAALPEVRPSVRVVRLDLGRAPPPLLRPPRLG